MTPQEASEGQPSAIAGTVGLYRFDGKMRAARIETAVASEKRADQKLVGADQANQQLAHS